MARPTVWQEPAGATALLAASALCVYGIARLCAARFYGPLGARPEDLKIGYPGLVEQSLGVVALALAGAVVATLVALTVAWLFREFAWKRLGWEERWTCLILLLAVLVALTVYDVIVGAYPVAGMSGLTATSVVLMLGFPQTWTVRVLPLSFVLVLVWFTSIMWEQARYDSDRARRGIAGTTNTLFEAPVLPWRSDVGRLAWKERVPAGLARRMCVLVLDRQRHARVRKRRERGPSNATS